MPLPTPTKNKCTPMATLHSPTSIFLIFAFAFTFAFVEGLGVNWGTKAAHQLPPSTVVRMLRDNGIKRVKLFDTDEVVMGALAGSAIEVMVGIPNDELARVSDAVGAKDWVKRNVSRYMFHGGVEIRYVAVGNEPFLASLNADGSLLNVTFPALRSIQTALDEAGLGNTVKATVPFNAGIYNSPATNPVPSAGRFEPGLAPLVTEIARFLDENHAPFTVNIYPFLSLYLDRNFPREFAFFDGEAAPLLDNGLAYTNVFDANFDTLVASLSAIGRGNMTIMVGEVGWPTDGDVNANASLAKRFHDGLLKHLATNQGTPRRPGRYVETYLFSLIDEDAKGVGPGNFERHWGIFRYDGQPKFAMDLEGKGRDKMLVGASDVKYLLEQWCVVNPNVKNLSEIGESIDYACTFSDCTSLGYGCSCHGLDLQGNASYAFNMYFQVQSHAQGSCDFGGLAVVTTQNASTGGCNFTIQIEPSSSAKTVISSLAVLYLSLVTTVLSFFFMV